MASDSVKAKVSVVLFRLGQSIFAAGIVLFAIAMLSSNWVVRPTVDVERENINLTTTLVTKHFGIFVACTQNEGRRGNTRVKCGSLWENLNFVSAGTVRFIQFIMVVAGLLYIISFSLEVVQVLPISKFRNFLAENRVVEMFGSIATVMVLTGMVIFAGEVKNKAERVPGQEDEQSGWSFVLAMIALIMCIFGLVIVTMFRSLPISEPGHKGGTWLRVAQVN